MNRKTINWLLILAILAAIFWIWYHRHHGPGVSPDYQAKIISAPATGTRGQPITVKLCTTNSSTLGSTAVASETHLYINTSSNITGATDLNTCIINGLPLKGYTNCTVNVTIPANQATGKNYLIEVCNKTGSVPESDSATNYNNTNVVSITIN